MWILQLRQDTFSYFNISYFVVLFQNILGKCIFNQYVQLDNQSTAILLIFPIYFHYCTAKKEYFIFNKSI